MKNNKLKIDILICHHKYSEYVKTEYLRPIQVGRAVSDTKLEYCIGDDTGVNISEKNKNWCELTAIYWQWKNVNADFYGLFHYRRYLSFKYKRDVFNEYNLDKDIIKKHRWNDWKINELCNEYDIVTAINFDIHNSEQPEKIITAYDFYVHNHHKLDIDTVINIIKKDYNFFLKSFLTSMEMKKCYFGNIHIMKREYYFEYCEIMFGILEDFEKQVDFNKYDAYQSRVIGFLAERISNAYLIYIKTKNKKIKITQRGLVCLYPFSKDKLGNFSYYNNRTLSEHDINVCFTFDNNYLYHGLTAIRSLIDSFNSNAELNIYIIHDKNLSDESIAIVKNEVGSEAKILFKLIDDTELNFLPLNRNHISINTYFRLLLHSILPMINKIIYLDSDIVVLGNITKLWNIPLENNCIGAALDEGGVTQSRRLSFKDDNYFNAGVIVFDLQKIRERYKNPYEYYIKCYEDYKERIILQDQDILNIAFLDSKKIIPLAWNLNTRVFVQNTLEHKYTEVDEIDAIKDVGIIHFTDRRKPWDVKCNHPYRNLYWLYRNKLHFNKFTLNERVALINNKYFKLSYRGYGSSVLVYVCNYEIRIKKSLLKYLGLS